MIDFIQSSRSQTNVIVKSTRADGRTTPKNTRSSVQQLRVDVAGWAARRVGGCVSGWMVDCGWVGGSVVAYGWLVGWVCTSFCV